MGKKAQVVWHLLVEQKVSLDFSAPTCESLLIITSWNRLNQENKPVSETFRLCIDLDA